MTVYENDRIAWQDNAKGIGISLVVFGHALRGLMAAHLLTGIIWSSVDFALYTFHMPLFMFLAGLNVPRSLEKGAVSFVKSKALSVAAPYFIWSTIQGLVMLVLASSLNSTPSHDLLSDELWHPISPFWFIYVLFIFLIAASFINKRFLFIISLIVFPLGELFGKDAVIHQLLHFALFFFLGMMSVNKGYLIVRRNVALISLIIATIFISIAIWQHFQNYNSVLMAPAAFGGGIFVVWLSQQLAKDWLTYLGRLSFPVYVMHIMATAGARVVMTKLLHVPHIAVVYIVSDVVAGITLPIAAYVVLDRLGLLPWLGLAIGQRGRRWIGRSKKDINVLV